MPYIGQVCFFLHLANVQNLDQTKLIQEKECIKIGQKRTFSRGTSRYDWPILPAGVANQYKGIVSYCPLADSAIYIIKLPIIASFRPWTCGSTLRFFSVSVLSSNKSLAQWHDLNNGEKDLYSGAQYPRKFGNPPILEMLVITWPYARPTVRPHQRHTNVK